MTRRQIIALLATGLAASWAMPAMAQAQPPLTLPQAVKLALSTSWSIGSANAQLAGANERIQEADNGFAPSVSLGAMPLRLGLLNPPDISALLNSLSPGLASAFSPDMISETVTVKQVLYEGGKIGLGQQAARIGADLALTQRQIQERDVAYNTASAYLGALRTQELENAATWGVRQASAHLSDAVLRERQGAGTQFDVLQARSALAAAQTRQIQADDAVKTTRLALGMLVHQRLGHRTLDPLPVLPDVQVKGRQKAQGLAARPEVRALEDQISLARNSAAMQRRNLLPTAAVEGIFGQSAGGPTRFYVLLGSLTWTIFDGGRTRSEIAQKDLAVKSSIDNLKAAKDGLRLQIDGALIDRNEARKRMRLSESSLETAQAAYNLAKLRFREGAGTGTEVIDATTAVVGAKNAYIQAMYDELGAEVTLAKAVGINLASLLEN